MGISYRTVREVPYLECDVLHKEITKEDIHLTDNLGGYIISKEAHDRLPADFVATENTTSSTITCFRMDDSLMPEDLHVGIWVKVHGHGACRLMCDRLGASTSRFVSVEEAKGWLDKEYGSNSYRSQLGHFEIFENGKFVICAIVKRILEFAPSQPDTPY